MNKKSKVTSVQANGTWEGSYGLMYKYEISFDNSDVGEYSSKSVEQTKFVIGQEVEYTYTGGKFPKVKPVYIAPVEGPGQSREDLIIRQSCIKAAAEISSNADSTIKCAELFFAWVKQMQPDRNGQKKETTNLPF